MDSTTTSCLHIRCDDRKIRPQENYLRKREKGRLRTQYLHYHTHHPVSTLYTDRIHHSWADSENCVSSHASTIVELSFFVFLYLCHCHYHCIGYLKLELYFVVLFVFIVRLPNRSPSKITYQIRICKSLSIYAILICRLKIKHSIFCAELRVFYKYDWNCINQGICDTIFKRK